MTLEHKDFHSVPLKALDEKGKGQAIIATLNSIDRDNDVTHPGAFGEQYVKILPAHDWKHPSVGDARLYESGSHVIADFELNLNMQSGREIYESLKWDVQRHKLQEWSYGFQVVDHERGTHEGKAVRFIKKVKAYEISPVVVGAGIGTGTLALKEGQMPDTPAESSRLPTELVEHLTRDAELRLARAITPHRGDVIDTPWNVFLMQRYVKATAEHPHYYHAAYAVADVPGSKKRADYRGLHHMVTPDGEVGPANRAACLWLKYMLHLGVFPAEEREGINAHIDQHLRDLGIEPLKLTAADDYGYPLKERFDLLIAQNRAAVEEAMTMHEIRSAKGLGLTEALRQQCGEIKRTWEAFAHVVHLIDTAPREAALQEFAEREFVRNLNEKIAGMEKSAQDKRDEVNRSIAEEHYQRFLELDRRIREAD